MKQLNLHNAAFGVALGAAYYLCLVKMIGLSAALALPSFLPRTTAGVVLWQELTHLIAVLMSAVPIAAALMYWTKDRALVWALIVGLGTALAAFIPSVLSNSVFIFTSLQTSALFVVAHIKIALAPALLIWMFKRLIPSNQPLHPTLRASAQSG